MTNNPFTPNIKRSMNAMTALDSYAHPIQHVDGFFTALGHKFINDLSAGYKYYNDVYEGWGAKMGAGVGMLSAYSVFYTLPLTRILGLSKIPKLAKGMTSTYKLLSKVKPQHIEQALTHATKGTVYGFYHNAKNPHLSWSEYFKEAGIEGVTFGAFGAVGSKIPKSIFVSPKDAGMKFGAYSAISMISDFASSGQIRTPSPETLVFNAIFASIGESSTPKEFQQEYSTQENSSVTPSNQTKNRRKANLDEKAVGSFLGMDYHDFVESLKNIDLLPEEQKTKYALARCWYDENGKLLNIVDALTTDKNVYWLDQGTIDLQPKEFDSFIDAILDKYQKGLTKKQNQELVHNILTKKKEAVSEIIQSLKAKEEKILTKIHEHSKEVEKFEKKDLEEGPDKKEAELYIEVEKVHHKQASQRTTKDKKVLADWEKTWRSLSKRRDMFGTKELTEKEVIHNLSSSVEIIKNKRYLETSKQNLSKYQKIHQEVMSDRAQREIYEKDIHKDLDKWASNLDELFDSNQAISHGGKNYTEKQQSYKEYIESQEYQKKSLTKKPITHSIRELTQGVDKELEGWKKRIEEIKHLTIEENVHLSKEDLKIREYLKEIEDLTTRYHESFGTGNSAKISNQYVEAINQLMTYAKRKNINGVKTKLKELENLEKLRDKEKCWEKEDEIIHTLQQQQLKKSNPKIKQLAQERRELECKVRQSKTPKEKADDLMQEVIDRQDKNLSWLKSMGGVQKIKEYLSGIQVPIFEGSQEHLNILLKELGASTNEPPSGKLNLESLFHYIKNGEYVSDWNSGDVQYLKNHWEDRKIHPKIRSYLNNPTAKNQTGLKNLCKDVFTPTDANNIMSTLGKISEHREHRELTPDQYIQLSKLQSKLDQEIQRCNTIKQNASTWVHEMTKDGHYKSDLPACWW